MNLRHQLPNLLVLFGSTLFVVYFFYPFIFTPNSNLLTDSGDGIKSYFVLQFHQQYDPDWLHFGGMNYPFGEHYGFTDGIPPLAWLLKSLPFLQPYSIALLHLGIFFSYILCAHFVFLILKRFNVQSWFAAWAAICIMALQPQTNRITGHFALSFAFFIPLSWYLLLRFLETPNKKWAVISSTNILIWFFVHVYTGMIITLFYLTYFLVRMIRERNKSLNVSVLGISVSLIPALIFFLFMKATDPVHDRPVDPYGFFVYTASYETVLVPSKPPLRHMMSQIIKVRKQEWEGLSYIGASTILILLISSLNNFRRRFLVKSSEDQEERPLLCIHRHFLAASVVLLFLSFGFPFNWFPDFLKYIEPLKQFRALGRFAWVFYYTSTVIATVLLHGWAYKQRSNRKLALFIQCFSFIFLGLNIVEAVPMQQDFRNDNLKPNVFEESLLTTEQLQMVEQARKADVQAILPLPYFHLGTDILVKRASEEVIRNSFLLSRYTGKPIFSCMMSRTSIGQTKQFMQAFVPDGVHKPIREKMKDCKNLLVYHRKKEQLLPEEKIVLSRAISFHTASDYELLILPMDSLFKKDESFTLKNFR